MLHERMTIAVGVPSRPPEDLYEPHAREIAQAVLPQPEPCCEDAKGGERDAYTATMRWWRVQIGLRRSISALNDLIDSHDATEAADCRCRNVVEGRAMRGALVVLWQRTARLLERMRAQAAAQEEREATDDNS
jgi:hypothetical protein